MPDGLTVTIIPYLIPDPEEQQERQKIHRKDIADIKMEFQQHQQDAHTEHQDAKDPDTKDRNTRFHLIDMLREKDAQQPAGQTDRPGEQIPQLPVSTAIIDIPAVDKRGHVSTCQQYHQQDRDPEGKKEFLEPGYPDPD